MQFFHGIRFRLLLVALVLLALPWLAAQFIASMETFLRQSQAEQIAATARVVAAALSDRPELFDRSGDEYDPLGEERRRIIALFAADDTAAVANLGTAYAPTEDVERLLAIMGRRSSRLWVIDTRSRVRGLSGSLRETRQAPPVRSWLHPLAAMIVPPPRVEVGDESKPVRAQIDRALIGISSTHWRGTRDRDVAILSAAQPIFNGDDIVGAVVVRRPRARSSCSSSRRWRSCSRSRSPWWARRSSCCSPSPRGSPRASAACTARRRRPSIPRGACAAPSRRRRRRTRSATSRAPWLPCSGGCATTTRTSRRWREG